jgi:type I restriction-modification system DNA methylase subunit/predicted type IV restriction endonuclease
MAASEKVLELVERFQRNLDVYKHAEYKETQVRVEFIDPFFEALGWDVRNVAGLAEQYKDVIHEDALKVSGATRAPDYCFRVGGTRKFFVEAKRPSAALKGDVGPAYQLRRYAWSAKLPLSILTDFEEFAVYDCRQRPKPADKASVGRVMYYTFDQYPDHLDDISAVFAKESVLKGSFDRYVQESKQKRGTGEVDAEFLKEIEGWREALARNVALRNPGLSVHELNDAVQRTIDRIIFLRICEDRGIEAYGRLMELTQPPAGSEPAGGSGSIYPRLVELYRQADQKYNAGLFDFQADTLTKTLAVDDRVLKPILADLYYPQSPYEFSVLPADILGQVYEQFLGKVIRLTPAHRAVVEEKPEVKKAGGVYYTPTYIVDTIVRQTVGKLVEGKTPRQLAGSARTAPLRILDPACGSGSFLLGAYQYLLDTHLHWYETNDPEKHARGRDPAIHRAPSPSQGEGRGGGWRLTTAEKKRILLTHIYGVDIDHQAVEVTKLSLLLKVLEGEQQVSFWSERVLPNLGDNVKCGNSLIGPDYYEGRQMGLFDDEELRRVNAFDWQAEFPQAMAAGGFDAVIGNPPWLMAGYYVSDEVLAYLRRKFETAKGKFDLYYPFIEQGCHLVSHSGLFGMIMPNKFFHTKAALNLRAFLSEPKWIRGIVDFGHERIFANATNYSCILFLRKQPGPNPKYTEAKAGLLTAKEFDVPWSAFSSDTWHFEDSKTRDIFKKLDEIGEPLEQITARFGTGVQSGADRLLAVDRDLAKAQLESELLRPVLRGRDVRRYMLSDNSKLLIFPYKVQAGKFVILSEAELQEYKNVYALLSKNRKRLAKRVWFSKSATELSGKWYGMMYLDSYHSFAAPHILTPSLSNHSNFALGEGDIFATGTAGVTSIIPKEDIKEAILYLLGVLNSNLIANRQRSWVQICGGGSRQRIVHFSS